MKRPLTTLVPLVAALLLALPVHSRPAHAAIWCKSDPVVSLNGTLVDVTVAIPLDYVPLVNGPVYYEIRTPKGVVRKLVVSDLGYNGYGVRVVFGDMTGTVTNKRFPTLVRAKVPIDKSKLPAGTVVPAELTVLPHNGSLLVKQGTTDLVELKLTVLGIQ